MRLMLMLRDVFIELTDVQRPEKISSAEISSICQAAGLQAVRKNRCVSLVEVWPSALSRCQTRVS